MENYENNTILGYDCDGNGIEEFRVLRYPFSSFIEDWNGSINVDPRFYCLVKSSSGSIYAVSIYDDYFSEQIRNYENLFKNEKIPFKIKTLSEMSSYEVAFDGIDGTEWFYDRDRKELQKKLDCFLNLEKGIVKKLKK